MTDCDHSDTRMLGTHPDGNQGWPVLFDDKPRNGLKSDVVCMECGTELTVWYRLEEIREMDGSVVWERD